MKKFTIGILGLMLAVSAFAILTDNFQEYVTTTNIEPSETGIVFCEANGNAVKCPSDIIVMPKAERPIPTELHCNSCITSNKAPERELIKQWCEKGAEVMSNGRLIVTTVAYDCEM